jgi:dihydroflavonol-4-reductase
MKIGITGASGHVGNVLCRNLIASGFSVKALYNSDKKALEGLDVTLDKGSVLDCDLLHQFVQDCDVVINCAAIISIHGDPDGKVFKTNTEGPKNVLTASIAQGVKKIIHLSSTHAVFETPLDQPFNEDRPYKTSQNYVYDYSKATGEQLMLKAFKEGLIQGCVVRPSAVIGPNDFKPSKIGTALLDFQAKKIPILPAGGYNFVDVRDVSNSIIQAIENGRNGEIYLLSGEYYTLKSFAALVSEVTKIKTPTRVLPFFLMRMTLPFVSFYGRIKKAAPVFTVEAIYALKHGHQFMDNTKAKTELGHQCRPLKTTITDFYAWHEANSKNS